MKKWSEREVERDQDATPDRIKVLSRCRAPSRHRRQSATAVRPSSPDHVALVRSHGKLRASRKQMFV
jgi:hypothetical protein